MGRHHAAGTCLILTVLLECFLDVRGHYHGQCALKIIKKLKKRKQHCKYFTKPVMLS